ARLLVINDFEALALALPSLGPADLAPIGGGRAEPDRTRAVLGAGTGLGVAGLVPARPRWIPIPGEGGPVRLAPNDGKEREVLRLLQQRFGRVSTERLLSGPGLENIFAALATLAGAKIETPPPDEITARGLAGSCEHSRAALDMFCAMLGAFAGDV